MHACCNIITLTKNMIVSKLHYISEGKTPEEHLQNIQSACTSGVELVQLNLQNVSEDQLLEVAKSAREITFHFQTRLVISKNYKIAKEVKAEGVYLETTDVCPTEVRKHLHTWQIIGSAAHNLQDCETLITKKVDYICLGPFKSSTTSKTDIPELGLKDYEAITAILNTEIPILGFGNITTDDVTDLLESGLSGIAVDQAITQNFDSIKVFNHLLKAAVTAEQRHTFE